MNGKSPENVLFSGLLNISENLSLGELRCATSGLEAVLKQYYCSFIWSIKAFRRLTPYFPLCVIPFMDRVNCGMKTNTIVQIIGAALKPNFQKFIVVRL